MHNSVVQTCLVLVLLLAVEGCAVKSIGYRGKFVSSDDTIAVKMADTHSGTWKTFDLVIDYQYENDDGLLLVSGRVELSQHYQLLYDRVHYLWVYLFLTDADHMIIDSVTLPAYMTHTEDSFTFNKYLELTDDVRGISFGYNGHVSEFDGHSSFSLLPGRG